MFENVNYDLWHIQRLFFPSLIKTVKKHSATHFKFDCKLQTLVKSNFVLNKSKKKNNPMGLLNLTSVTNSASNTKWNISLERHINVMISFINLLLSFMLTYAHIYELNCDVYVSF